MIKTKLNIGEKYSLFEYESKFRDYSFKGFYLGRKPEGNIFVLKNIKGQLKFYISNNQKKDNKFQVSEAENYKPLKLEEEYLINKLNEWKNNKNVA